MMIKELLQRQINTIEEEIKNLSEKIDYYDSINQPIVQLSKKLDEKRQELESIKRLIVD